MEQRKILIVEDESIIAADIKVILENLGYDVVALSISAEDAVQQAQTHQPDLALMDIELKGKMGGIEAAKILRTRFNIPVVFLTSYADNVTLEHALTAEPFGYILKPYSAHNLQTSIEIALYKHNLDQILKKNESTLRSIIERAGNGIIVTDKDGNILSSNPAFEEMSGFSSTELENKSLLELICPDSAARFQEQGGAFWRGETHRIRLENCLTHKDGNKVWISLAASRMDEAGSLPGHIVIMVDNISARVQIEEAYRTLIDQSPLGIIIIQNKKIIFANPKVCEMSGYGCHELKAMSAAQNQALIHPHDRAWVVKALEDCIKGKSIKPSYEYRHIRKDQQIRWLSVSICQTIYQGKPAILAFHNDIHEQKQLEELLRRGKNEWEATVDAVSDLIILTDTNDVILRCNQAAAKRFASNYEEIIGQKMYHLLPQTVSRKEGLQDLRGKIYIQELDGWFDAASFPLKLDHIIDGTVFLLKDITREKEMEAALLANQKMSSLGTLAAGLAHEMNSPLQVITSISESLLKQLEKGETVTPERLQHYMQMVNRNAWRNAEIVRTLRLYASSPQSDFEQIDINQVIHETLPLLKHRIDSHHPVAIFTQLEENLPLIRCSRENLSVVLVNTITNAIESMPEGGEIHIQTRYESASMGIMLQIQDNGTGIAQEIQNKIFDPFFTTKPVGSGLGLGLSATLGIVKSCGGEIGLESTPQEGTSITIYFPARTDISNSPASPESGRYEL